MSAGGLFLFFRWILWIENKGWLCFLQINNAPIIVTFLMYFVCFTYNCFRGHLFLYHSWCWFCTSSYHASCYISCLCTTTVFCLYDVLKLDIPFPTFGYSILHNQLECTIYWRILYLEAVPPNVDLVNKIWWIDYYYYYYYYGSI
jgi:hypothetical protein